MNMAGLVFFYRRLAVYGPRSLLQRLVYGLLLPLSWLYARVMRLRARLYRLGWLASYRAAVPVISVGNLSVGGTGKTPVVDYLIRYCQSRGKRVAVVSRGYASGGGATLRVVSAGHGPLLDVELAGDEPWLLARRNPEAIIVVAPRRSAGVRHAVDTLGAQVVLLDDGFQHLAVQRDFDLVLLDALHPFGNGKVLPAGLLREPVSALRRAQLFVLTRCPERSCKDPVLPGPVLHCRHELEDCILSLDGEKRSMKELAPSRGVAFAGVGEPESFFRALENHGLNLSRTFAFSDHAGYDAEVLARLAVAAEAADYYITTEKDAVKLTNADLPLPCFQVPLRLAFLENGSLERRLSAVIDTNNHER
jgi:tetraacyldisaccharide 4'-kinase